MESLFFNVTVNLRPLFYLTYVFCCRLTAASWRAWEGVIGGYKASILTQNQYCNLTQCESFEDFRTQLSATDYGNFLANEPLPISTSTITDKGAHRLGGV
ncbi:uncharacterized protein LACBIDRAFT_309143 [Laccaria bicolor S238N-H82]|uniref:Predicted protein n=1 Tax=Laccaria bicolor (strain S238N-H82 / ATCC MYA-4686) TaxID=486041 RepID=B0CVN4_LACBS|nr:uncharacterized protein LACBIDRAFT_309143 [Laccaria bicolor S238N-H82]EDR13775.1 predicted protein [Laccaria bicolor S238N-H82]|eukprot:XP_001876273.1 predicted protein [Laccaria bicolor S238N-H82]